MDMVSNQQMNFTQLLDTFQLFDTNKDGYISFEEVNSIDWDHLHLLF